MAIVAIEAIFELGHQGLPGLLHHTSQILFPGCGTSLLHLHNLPSNAAIATPVLDWYTPRKPWMIDAEASQRLYARQQHERNERLTSGPEQLQPLSTGDTVVFQHNPDPQIPGK